MSDIVLAVGDKEWRAHKFVLIAQSPVFADMFRFDAHANDNRVVIPDVKEKLFEQLLKFIYTGRVSGLDRVGLELFSLADKVYVPHWQFLIRLISFIYYLSYSSKWTHWNLCANSISARRSLTSRRWNCWTWPNCMARINSGRGLSTLSACMYSLSTFVAQILIYEHLSHRQTVIAVRQLNDYKPRKLVGIFPIDQWIPGFLDIDSRLNLIHILILHF